ncbi:MULTISPECIES: Mal regulon transcriptional regulator MalI [unclassified Photobacterium]|uniref:Mal regulon transcriptional regulator MalI n=1 Tax=unclassified Photobacterium TaxID=2628852 RepID=UPI000D1751E3|nr:MULTISPECIES: Mal regulon transcriptional regulator MalI [unclassified Photobacterium]PSV29890.1 Mal regulon transcriptional regulator MalI [Photobacterium sp. GB-72]PSV35306.1 Mal regulon transcriptional regulator MalI [Photobacterium sp. GB-210]PSV51202.1 Mal regulon transcriptional regulator MalI [Photobacterium sp. GB-1]PSV53865.1 Mal regulon transcriptional regulator MalI [Photobacterium sp. GB-3]
MAKSSKVKITDVADYAGVSVSTVSLVLGNKGRISKATIDKVNQAVEALGYVRNNAAANLRSNHSNLIGWILADITDPFYTEVTAGLSDELEQHDHMLFLAQSNHQADKLIQCVQSMIQQGVAGIAFSPVREATNKVLEMAKQANIPAVCLARSAVNNEVDYIGPDNHQAAILATQHLIQQGHRHIAYIGGSSDSLTRAERIGGYGTTLMQYGLPFKNEWIIEAQNNQCQAADHVQQLLTQHPKITALLCHRPAIALGAMYGIQRVGKSVGKDNYIGQQIGLIGFDDTPEAALTQPSLTMISSPTRQMGQLAGQRLLAKMTVHNETAQQFILPPQLIERGSA